MRISPQYGTLLLLFAMMSTSCHPLKKNKAAETLRFEWKKGGALPEDSAGSPSPGLAGPVAGISGDRLIIGGGSNFPGGAPWEGGKKKYYRRVYVFKKDADTIVPVKQGLYLPFAVAYSANATTAKGIIVAGGENGKGAVDKVMLLNWDTTAQRLEVRALPVLPRPLTAGACAVINGICYFAGGQNKAIVSDQLYALNLNDLKSGWDTLAPLPHPVTHAVLYGLSTAKGPRLYLVGGRKRNQRATSTLYKDVYRFDVKKNRWQQKAPLPYELSAHTGLAENDSTLLVFSGDQGRTFHETEVLLEKIAAEKDSESKQRLINEKNDLQRSHPGFKGNVLLYHTRSNTWKQIAAIPFPGQVTTTALKWGDKIIIPCGEIRAGVRTPEIIVGRVK